MSLSPEDASSLLADIARCSPGNWAARDDPSRVKAGALVDLDDESRWIRAGDLFDTRRQQITFTAMIANAPVGIHSPHITVSKAKSAQRIAHEIQTRLLPVHRERSARARELTHAAQRAEAAQRALFAELAAAFGATITARPFTRGSAVPDRIIGDELVIERTRDTHITFTVDIPDSRAVAFATHLAIWRNT